MCANIACVTVIVDVTSNIDELSVNDVSEAEAQIILHRFDLLPDHVKSDFAEALRLLNENGVKLAVCDKGHSIDSYFVCATLTGLETIRAMYTSGELRATLESVFNVLAKLKGRLRIKTFNEWTSEDYERCVQYFHKMSGI